MAEGLSPLNSYLQFLKTWAPFAEFQTVNRQKGLKKIDNSPKLDNMTSLGILTLKICITT